MKPEDCFEERRIVGAEAEKPWVQNTVMDDRRADLQLVRRANLQLVRREDLQLVRRADLQLVRREDLQLVRRADLQLVKRADLQLVDEHAQKKRKSIPTSRDEHVEKNVKSIANCRQEPRKEERLRQTDRRILVQEGSQPGQSRGT